MTHCSLTSGTSGRLALPGPASLGSLVIAMSVLGCSPAEPQPEQQQEMLAQDLGSLPPAALQQRLLTAPFGLRALAQEPVPQPVGGHIIDRAAAIRLGKAFFWDIQAGSDGQVACAVCHASFGSDARRVNTINPGLDGIFASGGVSGPGQTYTPVLIQNDDIVGVQGVARGTFVSVDPDPHIARENCTAIVDPIYGTERRVEFRQAPMIYGAVFMRQLFWAGEANDEFNGVTIWGFTGNSVLPALTHMTGSTLASQAVGPPGNSTEMRCTGRPLNGPTNSLGAKLLARPPLQFQRVARTDSVLGALANPGGPGLLCHGEPCSYRGLIERAFGPELAADAENRFSMLWGEAIQAYESTLIPDQTPFDRFFSGHLTALTPRQIVGLVTFVGRGNCAVCHAGAMLSDATVTYFQDHGALSRDGGDQGFHNIGLVESFFDVGRGGVGPGGVPLSISQSDFDNWAFKTPTLRNVKLTAPYFHTGSNPTLEDVVEFYNRGGDADNSERSADIRPLQLTGFEKAALVDFLANALTDCRVENQRAPFDHPELPVPNGSNKPAVGAEGVGHCPPWDDHGHGRDH